MITQDTTKKPPANAKYRRKQIKMGAVLYGRMVEMMLHGTFSCREISEETGLHYVTVLEYTREMYRAGACYIAHWDKDNRGRDMIKIYKIGKGKDAKRHTVSKAERAAKYRERKAAIRAANLLGVMK